MDPELSMLSVQTDESFESKKYRLERDLKKKLTMKKDLVPKTGKGSYDVTVPAPFDFMNAEKPFSTRERKFKEMMDKKIKDEE